MEGFLISVLMLFTFGIAASYALQCLHFQRKYSHVGPFPSKTKWVVWEEDIFFPQQHTQRVALWDWVRRLFGVYRIEGDLWHVKSDAAERWTCPFCLSFWVAIPFTAYWLVLFQQWLILPMAQLVIATVALHLYRLNTEVGIGIERLPVSSAAPGD